MDFRDQKSPVVALISHTPEPLNTYLTNLQGRLLSLLSSRGIFGASNTQFDGHTLPDRPLFPTISGAGVLESISADVRYAREVLPLLITDLHDEELENSARDLANDRFRTASESELLLELIQSAYRTYSPGSSDTIDEENLRCLFTAVGMESGGLTDALVRSITQPTPDTNEVLPFIVGHFMRIGGVFTPSYDSTTNPHEYVESLKRSPPLTLVNEDTITVPIPPLRLALLIVMSLHASLSEESSPNLHSQIGAHAARALYGDSSPLAAAMQSVSKNGD